MSKLSTGKISAGGRSGQYHHGDLRRALLDAAGALAEREGVAVLTVRAIAREVGVTHMAVYHHFRDRLHLLAGLATLGYERLGETMTRRMGGAADPASALMEAGVAYVAFAVQNPGMFRVMFSAELEELRGEEPLKGAATASFGVFAGALGGTAAARDGAELGATAAWALVHGISVLLLDRQLSASPADLAGAESTARAVLSRVRIGAPGAG